MKALMKAKKVGRFADGGEVDGNDLGAFNEGGSGDSSASSSSSGSSRASEPQSFKEAFAAARKGGAKTFEYKGKKYTTEMASARSGAPVPGRPRGESVPDAPTPQRADPTSKSLAERMEDTRARARTSGTGTDYRPVGQRVRESLGFANGGLVRRQTAKSHGRAC